MRLEEFVVRELKKLPYDRGLLFKDADQAWIRCPFHSGGNERTPSLRVKLKKTITPKGTIYPGHLYCFGCGKTFSWEELASLYKLRKIKTHELYADTFSDLFSEEEKDSILGVDSCKIPIDAMPWPSHVNWRTISGECVNKVGGMIYFDYTLNLTRCLLPVQIHGEIVGTIKANLEPSDKGKKNYLNSPGNWAKSRGLFPYDHIKNTKASVVYLVEGPRDSLNLIQYGAPSLAILGTSWSKEKRDLLLALDPSLVVVMLDPDEPGSKGARRIIKSLKELVPLVNFKFPVDKQGKKLMDASDLSEKQVKKLHNRYLARIGAPHAKGGISAGKGI